MTDIAFHRQQVASGYRAQQAGLERLADGIGAPAVSAWLRAGAALYGELADTFWCQTTASEGTQ